VLDRLAVMRVLSALMGAATVLLVYLFLSELLPGRRFVWCAGALVAAFQPLFGFMSGGVNNDNLLYLTAAGVFWALARSFRHGLTPANGALLGGFLGLGVVAKLTLLGFVPAVALALVLMLRRAWSADRPRALRGAAWALGLTASPFAVYFALKRLVWSGPAIPGGLGSVGAPAGATFKFNFHEELSHIWQLFLPPVGMRHQFAHMQLWHTWFKGFFGSFGWLDYGFSSWFYSIALAVSLVVLALAAGELVRRRRALGRRLGELVVYALTLLGVCLEVGVQSYRDHIQRGTESHFAQARYLLPLLCLYAAIAALAIRFGGRRFAPVIGATLVMLAVGHDLVAQAITISRYYA
jgi:4-amino-4-deoxy-L-arabinose transferase-like glycosyltransferase